MSQLFETLKKTQSELETQLRDHGKKAFAEHLTEFFEKNPRIEAVRWRQYTPYFNDGDTCHFNYYGIEVKGINIKPKYESDRGDDFFDSWSIEDKEIKNALDSLDKDLSSMEGALEIAFGDHAEVTATRQGIETDSYDHD